MSTKNLQNMKTLNLFLFCVHIKYDLIKLNARSIPFSNRKYKGREKTSKKLKNIASAIINSCGVLKI